jgi:methylmalonyl-CoA mutase cobalamin-binding domain/chain
MDESIVLNQLRDGVVNFNHEGIKEVAKLALRTGISPERALNEGLMRGMEEVDRRYQNDEYFLPDLIMAAEAMNEATKILFDREKIKFPPNNRVILATVKGDIHDIGKNLLDNFLNGLGIATHDLGVDVKKEDVVEAVVKLDAEVLALSSMISTSRDEIKDIIDELKKRGLRRDLKIIIGGSSTGKVFAKIAGADAYANDAPQGSLIIKKWIRKNNRMGEEGI